MRNYAGFLENLKNLYDVRPLKDHARRRKGRSICLLRHDIDDDFDKAILMAKLENELEVKASYFILPSAKYFDADSVSTIQGLGHELGLHNDVLTRCLRSRRVGYAKRLFEAELKKLKKNNITTFGVSPHESEICEKYGVNNHDIFKEYHTRGKSEQVKHTELFTLSLKKYKLYEADLLFQEHTFTDSGGEWNGGNPEGLGIYVHLNSIAAGGHTTIQVIIHPTEWEF